MASEFALTLLLSIACLAVDAASLAIDIVRLVDARRSKRKRAPEREKPAQ